jgi:hypothetical protein
MLLSALFILFATQNLIKKAYYLIILFFKQLNLKNTALIIFILLLVNFIYILFASDKSRHSLDAFLFEMMAESLQAPLSNIINHFAYYGFAVILIMFFWRNLVAFTNQHGFSYLSIICMAFIFSIGNESRYLINFIPFIFFPIFVKLNSFPIKTYMSAIYLILSLLLSRFWFIINVNSQFDWNNYMMSQGPWQPFKYYLIFLFIFILSLSVLYFMRSRIKKMNSL